MHKTQPIRILIDSASSHNFITVSALNRLSHVLIEEHKVLEFQTILGNMKRVYRKVQITLVVPNTTWSLKIFALVVDNLVTLPPVQISQNQILQKFPNVILNETYPRDSVSVDLLLSIQIYSRVMGEINKHLSDDLTLFDTKWGYALAGKQIVRTLCNDDENQNDVFVTSSPSFQYFTKSELLTKQMEHMWTLEKLPFDDDSSGLSKEEVDAVNLINKYCNYNPVKQRFETKLLFKTSPKFQNNFRHAKARLENMISKMKNDVNLQNGYAKVIEEYLEAGIIEEILNDTYSDAPMRTDLFYLPHRVLVDQKFITQIQNTISCSETFKT